MLFLQGFSDWGEVLAAQPGVGKVALRDGDRLPDKVSISDFAGTVTCGMVVTKTQCSEMQRMIIAAFQDVATQRALDAFEAGDLPAAVLVLRPPVQEELDASPGEGPRDTHLL